MYEITETKINRFIGLIGHFCARKIYFYWLISKRFCLLGYLFFLLSVYILYEKNVLNVVKVENPRGLLEVPPNTLAQKLEKISQKYCMHWGDSDHIRHDRDVRS